jgi:hypothetical protein
MMIGFVSASFRTAAGAKVGVGAGAERSLSCRPLASLLLNDICILYNSHSILNLESRNNNVTNYSYLLIKIIFSHLLLILDTKSQ